MNSHNSVHDLDLGWIPAVPLAGPRRWPAVLWCWTLGWTTKTEYGRGHRPHHDLYPRDYTEKYHVWECACGKAAWRDMDETNLMPGPMFGAIGFRRER